MNPERHPIRTRARVTWIPPEGDSVRGWWVARCSECGLLGTFATDARHQDVILPYAHEEATDHIRLWHTNLPIKETR